MFIVLESESVTLIVSQNYVSNISRQPLNSFKTLTILSLLWNSARLNYGVSFSSSYYYVKYRILSFCFLEKEITPGANDP